MLTEKITDKILPTPVSEFYPVPSQYLFIYFHKRRKKSFALLGVIVQRGANRLCAEWTVGVIRTDKHKHINGSNWLRSNGSDQRCQRARWLWWCYLRCDWQYWKICVVLVRCGGFRWDFGSNTRDGFLAWMFVATQQLC